MFCTPHSSLSMVVEKLLVLGSKCFLALLLFVAWDFGVRAIGYNLLVYEVSFPTLPNCHCT